MWARPTAIAKVNIPESLCQSYATIDITFGATAGSLPPVFRAVNRYPNSPQVALKITSTCPTTKLPRSLKCKLKVSGWQEGLLKGYAYIEPTLYMDSTNSNVSMTPIGFTIFVLEGTSGAHVVCVNETCENNLF